MNAFEKSEAIKASLRKGFRDGSSKMTKRRCYGYDVVSDGALVINSEEAKVVVWIFEQCPKPLPLSLPLKHISTKNSVRKIFSD